MSVIVEFRVSSDDFELGQILSVEGGSTIELERLVPLGDVSVPLFWVHSTARDTFLEAVQNHPSVGDARVVDVFEDRTLFTLQWDANQDQLINAVRENEGQISSAVGTASTWKMEIRFPTHELLSAFSADAEGAGISLEVTRVYNPSEPDVQPWYGLGTPTRGSHARDQDGLLRDPARLHDQGTRRRTGDFGSGRHRTPPARHRGARHLHASDR